MHISHYIYVITVHRQFALSYIEETNSGSVQLHVHSHFTLLPTHLLSITSELQLP